MRTYTEAQKELTGALVGLARSLDESNASRGALRAIVEGLRGIGGGEADLTRLLAAVREEKRRAVPDCAVCPHPCGRTDDYDPDGWARLSPAVAEEKERLLEAAIAYARRVRPEEGPFLPALTRLADALFAVGYDWFSPEELRAKTAGIYAMQ